MATILFTGRAVGLIVLPLMIFHQVQLFVCVLLAKRYASRDRRPAGDRLAANGSDPRLEPAGARQPLVGSLSRRDRRQREQGDEGTRPVTTALWGLLESAENSGYGQS